MIQFKKILGKQMIYDGTDEKYYDEHKIRKPGTKEIITSFNVIDAIGLEEFEMLSPNNISLTTNMLSFCPEVYKQVSSLGNNTYCYMSTSPNNQHIRKPLFYYKNKNHICLFCKGEVQYGRYQIWVEAILL